MGGFLNLKVRTKLVLTFALVLMLMTILGVFSLTELAAVRATTIDMAENQLPSIQYLAEMRNSLTDQRRTQLRGMLARNDEEKAAARKEGEDAQKNFKQYQAKYLPMIASPEEQKISDSITEANTEFQKTDGELDELLHQGKAGAAVDFILTTQKKVYDRESAAIAEDINLNVSDCDRANKLSATIYSTARLWIIGMLLCGIAIGLVAALFIARLISRPVQEAGEVAQQIASGDLTGHNVEIHSTDEIGNLGLSINTMQSKLRALIDSIGKNCAQVAAASEELSATSQQITANSEETSAQANVVSVATDEINRNLQTVAASTEEMSASISEIAKNAGEAAKVASDAMKAAADTDATVTKLGVSSAEIGQVIKTITSIAQQTNLLALNATIEAARAGEAGKGFAVVANEVKGLAKQTAKATEDISLRITAIQADAKSAVDAIKQISVVIGRVNDISATIATAVEEQSATTSEMSRNVSEAAKGSSEVSKNIGGVAQAANNTSSGASESHKAAMGLAAMSSELRELVGQFKY